MLAKPLDVYDYYLIIGFGLTLFTWLLGYIHPLLRKTNKIWKPPKKPFSTNVLYFFIDVFFWPLVLGFSIYLLIILHKLGPEGYAERRKELYTKVDKK